MAKFSLHQSKSKGKHQVVRVRQTTRQRQLQHKGQLIKQRVIEMVCNVTKQLSTSWWTRCPQNVLSQLQHLCNDYNKQEHYNHHVRLANQLNALNRRLQRLEKSMQTTSAGTGPSLTLPNHVAQSSTSTAAPSDSLLESTHPERASNLSSEADPAVAKYVKMQRMGVPEGAIRHSMEKDGVNPSLLFPGHTAAVPSSPPKRRISPDMLKHAKLKSTAKPEDQAPKPAARPSLITADMLVNAKKTKLKRATAAPPKKQPPKKPAAGVTADMLLAARSKIKAGQKKKRRTGPTPSKASAAGGRTSLADITNVKNMLKKTGGVRGSPAKKKKTNVLTDKSPSLAKSTGEFLQLALKRKFASIHAEMVTPATQKTQSHCFDT